MIFKRRTNWMIWIGLVVAVKCFSFFPSAVERYYSRGLYPVIGRILRVLFGWIPFSMGDIFYVAVFLWFLVWFFSFGKKAIARRLTRLQIRDALKNVIASLLIVYVAFNLLWGLNYNRLGIAYQLQLNAQPYSTPELRDILEVIVERLNQLDSLSRIQRPAFSSKRFVFSTAVAAYKNLSSQDIIFAYGSPSVKPSLFSYLGNFLGFAGYYNPFSGEAQVNTTIPPFTQPFTACHEIGHQLGYAKEHEANFAGFLAAKSSLSPAVRYSVYFDLYLYAASELYGRDSTLLKPLRDELHPDIRADYKDLRKFYARYQNPLEPYIRRMYGRYLRANEQPQGIMSYDEVTGWLVAYYKKFGKQAI
jgi:hypothetical protein